VEVCFSFVDRRFASVVLMPVSARKQLNELSDDLATKVALNHYNDAREAFIKAIAD
jgi:ATP-dependent Lon protease